MDFAFEGKRLRTAGDFYYVAPGAQLIGDVRLGEGASVWFNAVLRADDDYIEIGAGSNVQDATVIHCDAGMPTRVGRNVTIGHRVLLHGCTIGDDTLVGNGAIVLDGARIGRGCLVGAGAMVTPGKEFGDGSVLMGAPARVVRATGTRELAMIGHAARSYQERIRRYQRERIDGQGR
ncbi:MAG TPA: gamma carbonic anhydrase family protein [Steroidobacteraceae bacterium]|nr:gamma carbonic anhydrase family protein [Steroidobacteraceae bacterium]